MLRTRCCRLAIHTHMIPCQLQFCDARIEFRMILKGLEEKMTLMCPLLIRITRVGVNGCVYEGHRQRVGASTYESKRAQVFDI